MYFCLYLYSEMFPLHEISRSQNFFMHHLFKKTSRYSGFQKEEDGEILKSHIDGVVSFFDELIKKLDDANAVSNLIEKVFQDHRTYEIGNYLYRDIFQAVDSSLEADDCLKNYYGFRRRSFRKLFRLIDNEIRSLGDSSKKSKARRYSNVYSLSSSESDKTFYSRLSMSTARKYSNQRKTLKRQIIATPGELKRMQAKKDNIKNKVIAGFMQPFRSHHDIHEEEGDRRPSARPVIREQLEEDGMRRASARPLGLGKQVKVIELLAQHSSGTQYTEYTLGGSADLLSTARRATLKKTSSISLHPEEDSSCQFDFTRPVDDTYI